MDDGILEILGVEEGRILGRLLVVGDVVGLPDGMLEELGKELGP